MNNSLICTTAKKVEGYTELSGCISWIDDTGVLSIMLKGPVPDGHLRVHVRNNVPVSEISEAIYQFNYGQEDEYNMAVERADELVSRGEKMFVSDKTLHFDFILSEYLSDSDDIVNRDCDSDVGCGYFTKYHPTATLGVYRIETGTTCKVDLCNYNTVKYDVITANNYRELQQAATNISC